MRPSLRLLGLILLAMPCLAACVDVDEELSLDAKGGGLYELRITWDQALLDRLVHTAGATAAHRLRGRDLPLDIETWRDSLRDLEGLQVRHTQVLEQGDGRRMLRVQVGFDRLENLLRWELFARRSIQVSRPGMHRAELTMDPLARVPYLDPLATALRRIDAEGEEAGDGLGVLDPSPRERLGLSSRAAREARALLLPALADVRLAFRVKMPGLVTEVGKHGEVVGRERSEAGFVLDFAGLQQDADRSMHLVWRPDARDRVPALQHEGDRPSGPTREGAVR